MILHMEQLASSWTPTIQTFTLLVAALAFAFTTFYNIKNKKAKVLFDIFNESRGKSLTEARRVLQMRNAARERIDIEDFREYSFYLNHIGLLLYHNYVDVEEIYQLMGISIIDAWELLEPSIMEVRVGKRFAYQFHFQYLVARLKKYKQQGDAEIRKIISESAQTINSHQLLER